MSRPVRISVFLLLALLLAAPLQAQVAVRSDSTAFRATQLIAPGVLIGTGVAIHAFAHESIDYAVRDVAREWRRNSVSNASGDLVLRYMAAFPLVVDLGLGLTGLPQKHALQDRVIEAALASAMVGGTTLLMKKVVDSPRPDGSNDHSFPSGHSGLAFMGAELVRMEYGWAWGAGAYAMAATVAFLRCYNDRHWLSDVLLGAGIGILGAHVGEWLLEPVKTLFNIETPVAELKAAVLPTVDPMSGTVCASLALRF